MAETQSQTQSRMTDTNMWSGHSPQPAGQRAIQGGISSHRTVTRHHRQPRYPDWPTSRPGPLAKQPPPDQRPINLLRPEQMVEVG
jgi:hypothetical protein